MPNTYRCIAFVANHLMLAGLHTALSSCAKCCLVEGVNTPIFVFTAGIGEEERHLLQCTVSKVNPGVELHFLDADTGPYVCLRALHGDWMTYVRLGLPELLPEMDTILYLDADLVVLSGLKRLLSWPIGDAPFGASGVGVVESALENVFYKQVGLNATDRSFNAGVLLINAAKWRRDGLHAACLEFGAKHGDQLLAADQTLLTALFSREFLALPPQFNRAAYPERVVHEPADIVHFVGSPKPWDPFGIFIHRNSGVWMRHYAETSFSLVKFYLRNFRSALYRMWLLRRSYARSIVQRVRG